MSRIPVSAPDRLQARSDTARNWTALATIVRREVRRILRIWGQTLVPPAITMTLYFLILFALPSFGWLAKSTTPPP